ncbi:Oidioi.mRNA.OKI2018_I69.chr1.g2888.t2.cds [Oikopleura dioica]|uniref:Oidioi.mRNA.OKI2018_I69.chr1.g2888.t2.cds n=1 Tax=Oikopleura dioica TaxID=34765 RepID=A0ABN7SWC8_OIKDI|nr:Oidioi.mRNA.OKI2018_I69.chr1.g2888.t2.cds [Oikopleura dioica]
MLQRLSRTARATRIQIAKRGNATLSFEGKVAVVTGAGNGLGREYALELGKRGASVFVNDFGGSVHGAGGSTSAADAVVAEIIAAGGSAKANYASVEQPSEIIDPVLEEFGKVDILINNAGILRDKNILRISQEDWDDIISIHLTSAFKLSQQVFPVMKQNKFGKIINTTSASGLYGNFGQVNYSAAKMGLVGLTKTLFFLETGSVFEVAAGWAAKIQTESAAGAVFAKSKEEATLESVQQHFEAMCDFERDTVKLDSGSPLFAAGLAIFAWVPLAILESDFSKISKLYLKQSISETMSDSSLRNRWKRLRRRRTTDGVTNRVPPVERKSSESENLPRLIEEQAVITAQITSTLNEKDTSKQQKSVQDVLTESRTRNTRRRSVKRQNSDDESSVQQTSKRRSMGPENTSSVKIVRDEDVRKMIALETASDDRIEPLPEFTNEKERKKLKAKRRRSIATPTVNSIQEKSETPVKDEIKLPNLENLLTPETDEENSTEGALPIKESAKRCFPYQELYRGMVTDIKDKAVPCSIYNPQDPETEGKVMERHRCVLIEWLLEVATEEKYRRTTFHLAISLLDRYMFHREIIPKSQLQTLGTSCLYLAAKMEEVTPPDIYRLVEYSDGAVTIDDLVKIEFDMLRHLKWRVEALTPLSFILLFCQAPEFWTEDSVMPRFNEKLLCFCATILDLMKLDPESYQWTAAVLGGSIFIRVLEFVEVHREIRQEMNNDCSMELTDSKITELISSTLACHDSDLQNNCCDEYVTPFVAYFMKDILNKIKSGENARLPPPKQVASKGCTVEASRLQTNFYGEQGVFITMRDIRSLKDKFILVSSKGDAELKKFAEKLNIPFEFLRCKKYRKRLSKSTTS